jgi:hypothetical protein
MEIEFSSSDTIEEGLRKELELMRWHNKQLQGRINECVNELRTISNSKNLSADELRKFAFECLLRKGHITNDNRIV